MNLFELNFSVGCVAPFRDLEGRMGLLELIYFSFRFARSMMKD